MFLHSILVMVFISHLVFHEPSAAEDGLKTESVHLPEKMKTKRGAVIFSVSMDDCLSYFGELNAWNYFVKTQSKYYQFALFLRTDRNPKVIQRFKKRFKLDYNVIEDPEGKISSSLGFKGGSAVKIFSHSGFPLFSRNLGKKTRLSIEDEFKYIDSLMTRYAMGIDSLEEIGFITLDDNEYPIGRLSNSSPVQYEKKSRNIVITDDLFKQVVVFNSSGKFMNFLGADILKDSTIVKLITAQLDSTLIALLVIKINGEGFAYPRSSLLLFDRLSDKLIGEMVFKEDKFVVEDPLKIHPKTGQVFINLTLPVDSIVPSLVKNHNLVGIIDPKSKSLTTSFVQPDSIYSLGYYPSFCYKTRFDFDAEGNCYVVQPLSGAIRKYDQNLNLVQTIGVNTPFFHIEAPLKKGYSLEQEVEFMENSTLFFSLVCGEDGNIYLGYREKEKVNFVIYSKDGNIISRFESPGGAFIYADSQSQLYFIQVGENITVRKMRLKFL